ncbi:hypothetical protein FACS1894217_10160 [Clostridia bacterium]|nr:hypothetical protein FACS1894217_10160 [Clostridia bacterium]
MRNFEFFVDSSTDMSLALAQEFGLRVLPMTLLMNGNDYPEDFWQTISAKEFYTALRNGTPASTSQISREKFVQLFTECAAKGRDVLFVPLSAGISGTYEGACSAAAEVIEEYPEAKIRVVDSMNATIGHGLLCFNASAQAKANDWDVNQTAAWLEEHRHKTWALFTVDDLMFLHRGGRLGRMSAVAGSLLGIKPSLWVNEEGKLELKGKVRGRRAALDALVADMGKCVAPGAELATVTLAHGDCVEDAQYVREQVQAKYTVKRFITVMLGAVIGAHAGPGTVALFFECDVARHKL